MENYAGIFVLLLIGALGYYADKYYKQKRIDKVGWVMNCSQSKLKETINEYLTRFDDYQQLAADEDKPELVEFFVDSYSRLEVFYFELKKGKKINEKGRNYIRMLLKYSEKMASSELYEYPLRSVICNTSNN